MWQTVAGEMIRVNRLLTMLPTVLAVFNRKGKYDAAILVWFCSAVDFGVV